MLIALPDCLEAAIEAALREVPGTSWMKAARTVSERYRTQRNGTEAALVQGTGEALGYAALILPATYAQLMGAMQAAKARIPAWQPLSLLDIGSGPGTALWAALQHWPSLRTLDAWEREPAFLKLGQRLAAASNNAALRRTRWQRVVLGATRPTSSTSYDLVVLGHVLNELPVALRCEVLKLAWHLCSGVLLIVEPGTSTAFPIVKDARERLLALGAHTLAPCAHDSQCPLANDWCHFPQRLQRPHFQRRAREAPAGWEESKFCYTAVARFPAERPIWGRLIHQPHIQKGFVELTISSKDGLIRPRMPRREQAAYRQASSYAWGEALSEPPSTSDHTEEYST